MEKDLSGSSCGRSPVAGATESENGEKYRAYKNEPKSETDALTEALRQVDHQNEDEDKVHKRNQQHDDPPHRTTHDLEEHNDAINRHDRRPARFSGFDEDFPHRDDKHSEEEDVDKQGKAPDRGFAGSGLIGFSLGEQKIVHRGYNKQTVGF